MPAEPRRRVEPPFGPGSERRARALPAGYADSVDLQRKGLVFVWAAGQSITEISAEVANRVRWPLAVSIARGTYFVACGGHQNMVTRVPRRFVLQPLATERLRIAAACLNAALPIPGEADRFQRVARVPADLRRFLDAAEGEDAMAVQAGVWALSDGYDRGRVRSQLRLRSTSSHRGGPERGPPAGFDEGPAISDRQIDRARDLLDRLGLRHRL